MLFKSLNYMAYISSSQFSKQPKYYDCTDNCCYHFTNPSIGSNTYKTKKPASNQSANNSKKEID